MLILYHRPHTLEPTNPQYHPANKLSWQTKMLPPSQAAYMLLSYPRLAKIKLCQNCQTVGNYKIESGNGVHGQIALVLTDFHSAKVVVFSSLLKYSSGSHTRADTHRDNPKSGCLTPLLHLMQQGSCTSCSYKAQSFSASEIIWIQLPVLCLLQMCDNTFFLKTGQ